MRALQVTLPASVPAGVLEMMQIHSAVSRVGSLEKLLGADKIKVAVEGGDTDGTGTPPPVPSPALPALPSPQASFRLGQAKRSTM